MQWLTVRFKDGNNTTASSFVSLSKNIVGRGEGWQGAYYLVGHEVTKSAEWTMTQDI